MELQVLRKPLLPLLLCGVALAGCEKEISVDLPETEPFVVVEGNIETGQPPFVLLSRTQSYFASTSVASIAATFISDAVVTVNDGDSTYVLQRLCSDLIPDSLIEEAAAATGIDANLLRAANICAWTYDGSFVGQEGRTYRLDVQADGKHLEAVTTIPHGVALDSLWFRLANQRPNDDSLGFLWAHLTDPDTAGNAYRWFAQRINLGADGERKDSRFIAPLFSVFEDRYINGLSIDFSYNRGSAPYSSAQDDRNAEEGFFKRGDTVVVKYSSIGLKEFRFFDSYANNVSSQGDIFSNPANVRSNINGGLGVWVGYGARLDTVVCNP